MSKTRSALFKNHISLQSAASALKNSAAADQSDDLAEIVIVTHHTSEEDFSDILQNLNDLEVVQEVKAHIA